MSHTYPGDIDILLAAAQLPGLNAFVMTDAGSGTDVSNVTLALDDQATADLPSSGGFASGTFRLAKLDVKSRSAAPDNAHRHHLA